MPVPEPLLGLVLSARRRLWGWRLVSDLTVWLGAAAAGAAAVWGISRVAVVPWADRAVIVGTATALACGLGWWAAHRPSLSHAALWADHRLGGDDRLATAWELSALSDPGPAARRQIAEAGRWAGDADPGRLGAEYPSLRLAALAGMAVASALALALSPSLTDQALADQQAVRLAVEREAETLESLASEVPEELSERLGELVDALSGAESLEEAISALSSARLELEKGLDPNLPAENTALSGLAGRLSQSPIGRGDDPASQLSDLASSLAGLPPSVRQAAAAELAERASDFAGINEELASALADAASALGGDGFDLGQAAEALRQAASTVSAAQERAAAANAASEAAAALAESEARLRNARGQGGAGQGEGEGRGGGSGGGSGQGQGAGQGQGSGSGGGAGGGSSASSGVGAGSVAGTGDSDPAETPRYSSSVFEPPPGGLSEEVRVAIEGADPGEVIGLAGGPSTVNRPLVPYTERLAEYRAAALASLDRNPLPSHLTEVVKAYFTELEP